MKNLSLDYIIKEPDHNNAAPLILLIHGYGSNKEDLFSFAGELPQQAMIASVQAPLNLPFGGHAWYSINFDADENKFSDVEEGKIAVQKINIFVDELIENYNINTNKIFLVGFSQGAILSYATSFSFPNKYPFVVALSGYFNKEFLNNEPQHNQTDYFISHGSVDQVIPVEWAKKAPLILNELGVKNQYQEYPVGHGVHPLNFRDFKNWIEERL